MPDLPYMTEEAKQHIGRERVRVSEPVSARHIKMFAVGTDDLNPLYIDAGKASELPYGEIIAPPWYYGIPTRPVVPEGDLIEDGQYNDTAVPGVYGRSMAGTREMEFDHPIRVGDVITERRKLVGIEEKQGRKGKLILQHFETTYTNQRGELIALERGTTMFR